MTGNWVEQLKLLSGVYTPSERKVMYYLLKNEKTVKDMTLRMVAGEAGAGQPTVVRMLKKAGYLGWHEFIRQVWGEGEPAKEELLSEDNIPLALKSIQTDIKLIEEMALQLDIKKINRMVELFKNARMIDIYGTDNSAGAASELSGKLLHMGLPSRNYQDLFYQKISAGHLGSGDVAIGFSISGETRAVVDAMQVAQESRAVTVAVTGNRESSLAQYGDYVFYTPTVVLSEASRWISSRIAQTAFVDAICMAVIESDRKRFNKKLEHSISGFEEDVIAEKEKKVLWSIAP